jgi:hypothetical protein
MPAVRLVDTEISLYLGLARMALRMHREVPRLEAAGDVDTDDASPSLSPATTLVVRAGADDTLVMFLRGEAPMYVERLRSLTSTDAPDTICSRILLQQDEYGVGEVQHVLVLSTDREGELVESFKLFFPDAIVERLAEHVPVREARSSRAMADVQSSRPRPPAFASRVASVRKAPSSPINFVIRKVHASSAPKLPFTWHVGVMSAFCSS